MQDFLSTCILWGDVASTGMTKLRRNETLVTNRETGETGGITLPVCTTLCQSHLQEAGQGLSRKGHQGCISCQVLHSSQDTGRGGQEEAGHTFCFLFFAFLFIILCMCVHNSVHVCVGVHISQRLWVSLELESQAGSEPSNVSSGNQRWSPAGTVHALNHGATPLVPTL